MKTGLKPPSLPQQNAEPARYEYLAGTSMGTQWSVRYAAPQHSAPISARPEPAPAPKSRSETGSLARPETEQGSALRAGSAHELRPSPAAAILEKNIWMVLDRIVDQMSTWNPDSTISRLNRAPKGWYQLPPEFFHVLAHAMKIAAQTDGACDPTLGRLTNLWGFGPTGPIDVPPAPSDIASALAVSGWRRTALNHEMRGVWQPGGLHFDLSSIAKGYGVDEVSRVLDEHGTEHYLVELGGELRARGVGPCGPYWALEIEAPPTPPTSIRGMPITVTDCAIATSGDYRRYFQHRGRHYAHTLNPHTGRPLSQGLASVSVLHDQCMLADGLATALLCLGPRQGLAHAHQHHIAALFMAFHGADVTVEWTEAFHTRANSHR